MLREPYNAQVVKDVVELQDRSKAVPLAFHKWWGEGLREKYGTKLDEITRDIPEDVLIARYEEPGYWDSPTDDPDYRWAFSETQREEGAAKDATVLLDDWKYLDAYLDEFPDLNKQKDPFEKASSNIDQNPDRYALGHWPFCFYERIWSIRGMENVLRDFYANPDSLNKLFQAILNHHKQVVRGFAKAGADGILVTDDLGSQTSLMMSPDTFRQFLKPLYRELIREVHKLGMQFWLHSCGNVEEILGDLIEVDLDVIHPIQASAMDYDGVREQFGGLITFFIGFDVQYLLPGGTEEEVREGVRDIVHGFEREGGGLIIGAGNGILPDTPLENIRAFLEESTLQGA